MDLFQLETFLAVAEEGGFSRAAKRLYRTQPAVSQIVHKLEVEIGEALFDRSSREGVLTDAGLVLQTYAKRLLNMREEARGAIEELRHLYHGKLTIAANEFTCLYLLPLLDEFRRRYPMVKVAVQRSLASRVVEEILNHSAEFGVLTFRPDDSSVRAITVYRDDIAFVLPPDHPLARHKEISIKELGAESFVAHNVPSPMRAKVIDTFNRKKIPLHMDVELPSIEAIKRFVAKNKGVALLPAICVEDEVARGHLAAIKVKELCLERKLRIVFRANANISHAGKAFLNVAESFARKKGGRYIFKAERG